MINFEDFKNKNIKEHNLNWLQIPDLKNINKWTFNIKKKKSLFNLISHQLVIGNICFYPKGPYEAKYQFLINKSKGAGLKHLSDSKAFIKC